MTPGPGSTQYASVYVRKVAARTAASRSRRSCSAITTIAGFGNSVGFSVVLDEVLGLVMSPHNLARGASKHGSGLNYGIHDIALPAIWLISVSLRRRWRRRANSRSISVRPAAARSLQRLHLIGLASGVRQRGFHQGHCFDDPSVKDLEMCIDWPVSHANNGIDRSSLVAPSDSAACRCWPYSSCGSMRAASDRG